ncbi:hypothetical protein BGZ51_008868 [Haplosporangium sp. Z 767]|nr:hypothetical protein BGZ51_008868 [Haplosporangium sp. Z 767]
MKHGVGVSTSHWNMGFEGNGRNSDEGPSNSRKVYKGKQSMTRRISSDRDTSQEPEELWVEENRKMNLDNSTIYIPSDPRISQVVVRFTEDTRQIQHPLTEEPCQQQNQKTPATAMYRPGTSSSTIGKDPTGTTYTLNFSSSGDSLSEMIFKSTHGASSATSSKLTFAPMSIAQTIAAGEASENGKDHIRVKEDTPNPARVRATATKASLTLSSDSSSSESSTMSTSSTAEIDGLEQIAALNVRPAPPSDRAFVQGTEGTVVGLAMIPATPSETTFKDQSYGRPEQSEGEEPTSGMSSDIASKQSARAESSKLDSAPGHSRAIVHDRIDTLDNFQPRMQPNSSDSSPSLSSLSSSSSKQGDSHGMTRCCDYASIRSVFSSVAGSRQSLISSPTSPAAILPTSVRTSPELVPSGTPISFPSPPPTIPIASTAASVRPKLGFASLPLQYWRTRIGQSSSHQVPESTVTPTSSFAQSLASTFTKKKKIQIPTIVLHPDEENGEPPRVLTQKDIDYLTTMPPTPLRPLIQSWDDISEEGEYNYEFNEGYPYDNYHDLHHPHYHYNQEYYDHLIRDSYGSELPSDHSGYLNEEICDIGEHGSQDPFVLDVPIDLDINTQELDNVSQ